MTLYRPQRTLAETPSWTLWMPMLLRDMTLLFCVSVNTSPGAVNVGFQFGEIVSFLGAIE